MDIDELIVNLTGREKAYLFDILLNTKAKRGECCLNFISYALYLADASYIAGSNKEFLVRHIYKKLTGIDIKSISDYKFVW
jgi:hypothetical protein